MVMEAEMKDYKTLQEKFVSDHNGTSLIEIAFVVTSAPLAILVRDLLLLWLFHDWKIPSSIKCIVDFVLLLMPVLVCFTVVADHWDAVLSAGAFTAISVLVMMDRTTPSDSPLGQPISSILNLKMDNKRPFITHFRAYVNIAAAISILAVDFTIFPRRFCKAETFGTGLMDVGVGAYVISNAIVSPEARGKFPPTSTFTAKVHQIRKSVFSSLPLWVLGICRLVAVKGAEYQEHVSEYGVHWNFFFTIALVRVLSTMLLCMVDVKWSGLLSLVTAAGYQYFLSNTDLQSFILTGSDGQHSRDGFLNANREGIFSCLGYLAIYFAGIQLGHFLLKPRETMKDWIRALISLCILDALCWIVLYLVEDFVDPVSRRMANLSYVIWMLAYNLQLLPSFLLVDLIITAVKHITSPHQHSNNVETRRAQNGFCLLEAINRNGLLYFLLLNLFTGLVNMSMHTVYALPSTALVVMVLYLLTLSVVISVLHAYNITAKFW